MKKLILTVVAALLIGTGYIATDIPGVLDKKQPQISETVSAPEELQSVKKEGLAPNRYADVYVVRVVDGDTFEATYDGETQKVRLLCVDTPESVKHGVSKQPYSKEAFQYTSDRILDKSVRLVFEKGLRDRYGRLLAHVLLKDGGYLNAMLVRNGLARVEIVSPNSKFKDYFNNLQQEAISAKAGFWGLSSDKRPFVKDDEGKYVPGYKLKKAS